ncbi:MAG: NAD/NADP octopine/nopaline dehydrogenase family protein [Thermoguttaceae bacterium]|jgi:opine dehydrogenase|nr:NAD/NADP octopine/nopaline dehydrogenase family protein [Thermoguttaceae bacterium]
MKIGVLGSGNGGCAAAFDFAHAGHDVSLFDFPQFPDNIAAIAASRGIFAEGELNGFAELDYAGHDLQRVVSGSRLLLVVGPAYSTEPFATACKPYLEPGQVVVVCPSSCAGAVVFKSALGLALGDESVLVADTSTLPYAVRVTEPGRIHVFLKLRGGLFLAAMPGRRTGEVLALLDEVYPCMKPAANVLQTALQNGNPVIHPAISLLNAAQIERTGGNFFFYEDGVTPAVGRLIEAVDRERLAVGAKLGLDIVPDPMLGVEQGYMLEPSYDRGFSEAPGFRGIRAQSSLDYRYFHEDVGFGLVFLTSLGKLAGVETPVADAVIDIVSVIMDRNYRKESARSLEKLGLADKPLAEIIEQL